MKLSLCQIRNLFYLNIFDCAEKLDCINTKSFWLWLPYFYLLTTMASSLLFKCFIIVTSFYKIICFALIWSFATLKCSFGKIWWDVLCVLHGMNFPLIHFTTKSFYFYKNGPILIVSCNCLIFVFFHFSSMEECDI